MNGPMLTPYLDRVQLLAPDVAHDAFRRATDGDAAAQARRHAFTAAVGLLHRYATAVRALGQAPEPAVEAVVRAGTATVRAAWRPSTGLLAEAERALRDVLARARAAAAASSSALAEDGLAARLAWHGDPEVAAERRMLLEDADEAISLAAAAAATFANVAPAPFLGGVTLQLARLILAELDDETRWRVEAAAQAEAVSRELFTDPFGGAMWCGLLSPDRIPELLSDLVCADEEAPVALAAAGERSMAEPGVVHVLLYHEDLEHGVVVRLRVRHQPDGRVWGQDRGYGPDAWNAVRNAWYAAAAMLPPGEHPPDVLEAYTLEIDTNARVDGASLGLPAALAFWSLWTGARLPREAAATGAITPGGAVRAVDGRGLKAKLRAWRAQFGDGDVPALVPDQDEAGGDTARCLSLEGALAVLGEAAPRSALPSELGGVAAREDALRVCISAVRTQDLGRTPSVGGASPWVTLADRMRLLIGSLHSVPGVDMDLAEPRLWCALAYIHGARSVDARAMLAEVDAKSDRARLLSALLRLNEAIDVPVPDEDALEAALAEAPQNSGFQAHALGTRGRFHMHRGRLTAALPLLQQAIEAAQPHERAQSRVYFAMALRMDGRPADGLNELVTAVGELRSHTEPYSARYRRETEMYLAYERARTLLALDRAPEALASIDAALVALGGAEGWWPRLGFLRTRAQVLLRLGRRSDWEEVVEEAVRLAPADPGPYRPFVEGLVAEARGEDVGVVY